MHIISGGNSPFTIHHSQFTIKGGHSLIRSSTHHHTITPSHHHIIKSLSNLNFSQTSMLRTNCLKNINHAHLLELTIITFTTI
jgi:hypothetical protein